VSHGRWLYAGDGNSTLKVIDLDAPTATAIKQSVPNGGTLRLDEMALTPDGGLLLAANNADNPAFGTLYRSSQRF
jgi:DNA-binding beta-propeller fold protein YncE